MLETGFAKMASFIFPLNNNPIMVNNWEVLVIYKKEKKMAHYVSKMKS